MRERIMKIGKHNLTWHLWALPIFALVFSGYFLKKYMDQKGVEIKVSFSDAKSIQPDKTRVFYRGVPIGTVSSISLSEDGTRAICYISLQKDSSQFAVEGSKFYLVSPKVGFEGVSGLETLISGSYISVEPGDSKNSSQLEFKGESSKQSIETEENVTAYVLETDHAESVSSGDSVFFRGLVVGTVGDVNLSKSAQTVLINIHIRNKYARIIRNNTAFWKKQGIKADLGLFKSKIRINSLDTILKGGVEFATPNDAGAIARPGQRFPLLFDEPKDHEEKKWNPDLGIEKRKIANKDQKKGSVPKKSAPAAKK
jgi:paraquat-inducible protein B